MKNAEEIKQMVREKYSSIAEQDKETNQSSCCGSTCCSTDVVNIMTEDYKSLEGYHPEADLGLGCGLPTQFAKIKKGDVVVDLGSGAGNDCFIARSETGESGKVIGVDMTEAMIARARKNAEKLGYHNIEFRLGEIESLPITSGSIDVVVSNCVLNLVPDKVKAFAEIHRILKDGGHFSISDVVLSGQLPDSILKVAELYSGCVTGAIPKADYLQIIQDLGFTNLQIQKERIIELPDDVLKQYLAPGEILEFRESKAGIYSISVYAEKQSQSCCDKETCCK